MPDKKALVIRHVHCEDLGAFTSVLTDRGFAVHYLDVGVDGFEDVLATEPDLLVVLGAPVGAFDEKAYPFLVDEMMLIERRIQADRPTLGVCLGAQLIARALGGTVTKMKKPEIGFAPIELTPDGLASALVPFSDEGAMVLHWHGDACEPPPGTKVLARTDACEVQAFSKGDTILGLQFHAEFDGSTLEQWLITHASEIAKNRSITPQKLREQAVGNAARIAADGRTMLSNWLTRAGL